MAFFLLAAEGVGEMAIWICRQLFRNKFTKWSSLTMTFLALRLQLCG